MVARHKTQGAALLIVVFLLLIVILLALTFYAASRTELRVATANRDAVQANFAAEAGIATAMAFLRHDLLVHPTVTSLDHAWKTYFNGAWFVGKPTWQPNAIVSPRLSRNEYLNFGDRIYIPKFMDTSGSWGDFVIPGNVSQRERINTWADVDLDDDGLKDAMWIPLAIERIADADGLDNDLDGEIDEFGELAIFLYYEETSDRVFLTAPIVVDYTGDGAPDPLPTFTVNRNGRQFTINPNPGSPDIDALDNNFDFIVDNATSVVLGTSEASNRYYPIATQYLNPNGRQIASTGEPVSDIVGRYAVLISDEASKANWNTSHALKGDVTLRRAINEGLGPHEYDLRILPQIGQVRAQNIAQWRTGNAEPPFTISFPGNGFIDDNGDAFWRAINGLDDDGDGLYDNGIFTPGLLEGIDEPQEFRLFRPYPYVLDDGVTIDKDRSDRSFFTREDVKNVTGIAGGIFADVRNYVTVNSSDKNDRYQYYDRGGNLLPFPVKSGQKLDFNYAFPEQIATALINDWPYRPSDFSELPVTYSFGYVAGLRQEAITYQFSTSITLPDGSTRPRRVHYDGELRAYQLGVNVVDNRDLNHVRTTATLQADDSWAAAQGLPTSRLYYTVAGVESIRINEIMVRATRRVEAESLTELGNTVLFPPGTLSEQFDPNQFSAPTFGRPDFDVLRRTIPWERVYQAWNGNDQVYIGPNNPWPGDIQSLPVPTPFGPCLSVMGRLDVPGKYGDGIEVNDRPTPPHIGPESYIAFQAPVQRQGDDGYSDYRIGATRLRYADASNSVEVTQFHDVPNMVQWRFGPGPGLPPGRYYLLANTTRNGNADTATVRRDTSGHLRFTFKYGRASEDIVADALGDGTGYIDFLNTDQGLVRQPIVGTYRDTNGNERETGWVFLPGLAQPDSTLTGVRANYGNRPEFYAYTVVIPPYAANPAEQEYLYVAVWKGEDTPDEDLCINWFEFSQEPDHEWVEIVHTGARDPNLPDTEQYVDLSGWQLQVGTPGGIGGEEDHRLFTIPDGTKLAVGGSLLLGVNKFDFGARQFAAATGQYAVMSVLDRNGIGLCATNRPQVFPMFGLTTSPPDRSVTVPPFPTVNWIDNAPLWQSVFYRDVLEDFVDVDGDGTGDRGTLEDIIENSAPQPFENYAADTAKKPWDRIVQLRNTELETLGVAGDPLDALARIVLKGGVFPNYPEEDGADNDDDNQYLISDGVFNNDAVNPVNDSFEGIDEGREWLERRRAGENIAVPGRYSPQGLNVWVAQNGSPTQIVVSSGNEEPEWKEFLERRFMPGDCVTVTLYQGLAADNRIVDRVTYTQRDVENRAINDALTCNYRDENGVLARLDPSNPFMWPDNTMGVDFYRSLERKHPLYTGDRFGTRNRWEPTDGNYDDWDSGMGPVWFSASGAQIRWDSGGGPHARQRYAHSVSGSPLRMNFFQRAFEDKLTAETSDTRVPQFLNANTLQDERPARVVRDPSLIPYWHLERGVIRNRTYSSPGELVRLPHWSMVTDLRPVTNEMAPARQVPDQILLGHAPHPTDPVRLNTADVRALVAIGANCSQTLSCATAEFYPVWPRPDSPGVGSPAQYGLLSAWDRNAARFPRVWTPIFLFNLGETTDGAPVDDFGGVPNVRVQANYLLNPPQTVPSPFSSVSAYYTHLRTRWPLEKRAVMYVASNDLAFEPSQRDPQNIDYTTWDANGAAEALFVWDADDGVENGVYELYVATADDLSQLDTLSPQRKQELFTPNTSGTFQGTDVLDAARNAAPTQLGTTIQVFTDRDGNRRCWTGDRFPAPGLMNDSEKIGELRAAQPTPEGLIYFGTVRIENNYLAVLLRNWAKGGQLNRFSRVILSGVERTPGRINVNTIDLPKAAAPQDVNTLAGVPGILAAGFSFDVANNTFQITYPLDTASVGPSYARSRANQVLLSRPEHFDGRYYDLLADLLTVDPSGLPRLDFSDTLVFDTSGRSDEEKYEEKVLRFSRSLNLITTRSDVFEIYALGQSGYVSTRDLNGDGRIDFRNDFVVTGETKLRTVYER